MEREWTVERDVRRVERGAGRGPNGEDCCCWVEEDDAMVVFVLFC